MSDDENATSNMMDTDAVPNEFSVSSAQATSSVILDLDIGSGDIYGSDDDEINEETPSKSSTPDSTTLPTTVIKKTATSHKPALTKNKSSLVNYERDSDDDEHSDEEQDEEDNNQQNGNEDNSNSNSAVILHSAGESDFIQSVGNASNEQTIVTSDLLNVTPLKQEDASPSARIDLTPNYPYMFPEDADIRIPPEPTRSCSTKLEDKFDQYYKRLKKSGVDQNALIQELKDFRNPCMYEKIISHLNIDEIGTNFPQNLYDPHLWGKESYYDELSKAQKLEMDRREKERRERQKIGFTPGVKKVEQLGVVSSINLDTGGEKRKTRFDQ